MTRCAFHDRHGEHGGLMAVEGVAPAGLLWRLGAPGEAPTAWFRNERAV